jgi:hypothetical protein
MYDNRVNRELRANPIKICGDRIVTIYIDQPFKWRTLRRGLLDLRRRTRGSRFDAQFGGFKVVV